MSRGAGEIRLALLSAAEALAEERAASGAPLAAATGREIARRACVGLDAARRTLDNMVRAGALLVVGSAPSEGAGRPPHLYAPPPELSAAAQLTSLQRVRALSAD